MFVLPNPRRTAAPALLLLLAVSFALVLLPAWMIWPMRAQTPRMIDVSYAIKRVAPLATLACALATLAVAAVRWRPARAWWRRAGLVVAGALTILAAWLARQNHFEWMFRPLLHASYASAADAKAWVDPDDLVLAVAQRGEAAAYPVRLMAYHHIVQDAVGGVPIVVTY